MAEKVVNIHPAVTSMPTLKAQYEKYASWCKLLGMRPSDYDTWLTNSKKVSQIYGR